MDLSFFEERVEAYLNGLDFIRVCSDEGYSCNCRVFAEDPLPGLASILESEGERFCDLTFGPCDPFSICSHYDHNTLSWYRCCALRQFLRWRRFARPLIFDPDLPYDIQQSGKLGDCWFLALLPHLTPADILRIFGSFQQNSIGAYSLNLQIGDIKGWVLIDDRIPVALHGEAKPIFVTSANFAYMFLEKAFAKIFGCYQNLCGGKKGFGIPNRSTFVTKALYGCQSSLSISWTRGSPPHDLWDRLCRFISEGAKVNVFMGKNERGIVSGHAYSVLEIYEFVVEDCEQCEHEGILTQKRFVRICNPQGDGGAVWEGRWCQDDAIWDRREHEELKKMMFSGVGSNGKFVMQYEDFAEFFGQFDVYCH